MPMGLAPRLVFYHHEKNRISENKDVDKVCKITVAVAHNK